MTKLQLSIILLVISLSLSSCNPLSNQPSLEYEVTSDKELTAFITSDTHYLSEKLTDHGEAFQTYIASGDGKRSEDMDAILSGFQYEIKLQRPDILIISGDLTNNGELKSHQDLASKLQSIEKLGTSVYVIPGNHDLFNPWARNFKEDKQYRTDSITDTEFTDMYENYGYNEAISRDKASLSYLVSPTKKVWLLMLDTTIYRNNINIGYPQTDGELSSSTLAWIEESGSLAKQHGAQLIAVMHHNLIDHSKVIRNGFTLNNNEEAIDVFREVGIPFVFSGHIHVQDISSNKEGKEPIYDIASSSLAVNPHQYGILKYSFEANTFDYSTKQIGMEQWALHSGIKDERWVDFKKYSGDYFGKYAFNMASIELTKNMQYTEDQLQLMSDIMQTLNIRYFSGVENENKRDLIHSEGYKLWLDAPESFLKSYVLSIVQDLDMDDNLLHIKGHTEPPY
jgi:3',5'-cyclic AMP phosphodiesterase CpdA